MTLARLVWQPATLDHPQVLTVDLPADDLYEMRELIGTQEWVRSEAVMWIDCRIGDERMTKGLFRLALITSLEPLASPRPQEEPVPDQPTPAQQLADAKERLRLPKSVAICGSTRFMQQMADAAKTLSWAGIIVVKPECDMKQPDPLWADPVEAEAGKVRLDDLHRAKIRFADEVLIVGDYVGESTTAEIAYARQLGKTVKFTHPEVDPDLREAPDARP